MNNRLGKVWVDLAYQQFCNYRLVNVVISKSIETCCLLGPQSSINNCQSRSDDALNPLEFHGKRRAGWPTRPQAGEPVA